MNNSVSNIAKLAIAISLTTALSVKADFKEHYDLGQSYAAQYQYSGAIAEFKSALRINYLDNSARIGLINAYLARATEYANKDKAWTKAADDFRSALFYMKYYPSDSLVQNSATFITQTENNLDKCLDAANYDISPENRYNTAKTLRAEGNFPAAGYEFMQALGSKNLQKSSFEQVADILRILGNEPKSAEFYKKAIAVAPNDLKLRLSYAKILDKTGANDDAWKEYSYVLQKANVQDKEILYSLEKTFEKKLQSSPQNANFNANMGAVLQKEGKLDSALEYYKKAEALDPSNINTRINTGTLYQQKGDYKTAIKAYESVLILYPNNINANLYRAQCLDKIGETKTAQDIYKKILAIDPNNELLKAQMTENAKKTLTASQFVDYVKNNLSGSNPADILYDYAIELHKASKLEDSIFMYEESIKLDGGKNPEMYVNLALAQAQGKNFDGALKTLHTAEGKFPQNTEVKDKLKDIFAMKADNQMNLASEAFQKKNYDDAITYYLAVKPESANSMLGVASSYQELGNKEKAIEYYQKALQLKPVDTDIAYYIACLYGELEDYASAKDYLQKAITFDKNNKQAIEYLQSIEDADRSNTLNNAIALYDEGNFDESLAKFNDILSKDSDNVYALYYRGMIYEGKNKHWEAIVDLKKAIGLNADFKICNYLIATDYDTLGKYKEARQYYLAYATSDVEEDEYKKYATDRAEELKEYDK